MAYQTVDENGAPVVNFDEAPTSVKITFKDGSVAHIDDNAKVVYKNEIFDLKQIPDVLSGKPYEVGKYD